MRVRKGNPVTGADFWPRPDIVDPLVDDLVHGRASRKLFGLKRIGKTSIQIEVERRLREDKRYAVVHIDVQAIGQFKDFIGRLFSELPESDQYTAAKKSFASNRLVQKLLPAVAGRFLNATLHDTTPGFINEFAHLTIWQGDIERALREAAPVVLILDELPFMLRNMLNRGDYKPSDVELFLAVLKSWRSNCGVRMILSGSIGLYQLQRDHRIAVFDHVNDAPKLVLPPLSEAEAVGMVEALAAGECVPDWTPELSRAVVDASAETWPIFLQYGFDAVWRSGERDPRAVADVIEDKVRPQLEEDFYSQFSRRLSAYAGDRRAAQTILKAVYSANPQSTPFRLIDDALEKAGAADRRDDLLEALSEDDFLDFDTKAQTIRLASKLVAVWLAARAWTV